MMTRYTEARLREYLRQLRAEIEATNICGAHYALGVQAAIDIADGKQVTAPHDVAIRTEAIGVTDEREVEEVLPDVEERTCDTGRDTEEQQTEE